MIEAVDVERKGGKREGLASSEKHAHFICGTVLTKGLFQTSLIVHVSLMLDKERKEG